MRWTIAVVVGLAATSATLADTITLSSVLDNTLYEDSAGALSNGAGIYTFAGKTSQGRARRALFAFDLSSIPLGSVVTSASLTLTTDQSVASSTPYTLHRVLTTWGEGSSDAGTPGGGGTASTAGDATWAHRFFSTQSWSTLGGDFVPAPSATKSISGVGSYTWTSASTTADVQSWLNGSAVNAGWALLGNEQASGNASRFGSHEHADPNLRPRLVIEYTPAPAPGAAAALALGGLALTRRRR